MNVRVLVGGPEPTFWEQICNASKFYKELYEAFKATNPFGPLPCDIMLHMIVGLIFVVVFYLIGNIIRCVIKDYFVKSFDSDKIFVNIFMFVLILLIGLSKEVFDFCMMSSYNFWIETPKDIFYTFVPFGVYLYLQSLFSTRERSPDAD